MKFYIALSITLLILATTTQGFLLKAAIKKKLPSLIPSSLSGLTSSLTQTQSGSSLSDSPSGTISSLSEQINNESFESSLNEDVPPMVTLYPYPPQHQVIYRSVRPVVRRTVYVQAPPPTTTTYSGDRALPSFIGNFLPNPLTQALRGVKSALGSAFRPPAKSPLASALPAALAVPAPQTYYLY